MTDEELLRQWESAHCYEHAVEVRGERRTRLVVAITAAMMLLELAAGWAYGSIALLADGWHMASHAAALGIAVFAYAFARRHAQDPRYSFGTGKVNALGGFASAVLLIVVAALMLWEAGARLLEPVAIAYDAALLVAVLGLVVNAVCAWLLGAVHGASQAHAHSHGHEHGHAHEHDVHHGSPEAHTDHNLRAAYVHVLADALTSMLAIGALLAGKLWGLRFMDPLMGAVGAVVILRWAAQLVRVTSRELLDAGTGPEVVSRVRGALESEPGTKVCDLHVWSVGPGHLAVIASLATPELRDPGVYKRRLASMPNITHVTVEVHQRAPAA